MQVNLSREDLVAIQNALALRTAVLAQSDSNHVPNAKGESAVQRSIDLRQKIIREITAGDRLRAWELEPEA
jgi:hypothetical protein